MPMYYYQTNGEEVACVNCKNTGFARRAPVKVKDGELVPYECERCHFVSWFPEEIAPVADKPAK